jgi:diguanylate cyclase (GGDEF)-like protein
MAAPERTAPERAAPERNAPETQTIRVLMVEDNSADAERVAQMLRSAGDGFEIARARSVEDALLRLAEETYHCVLLDLTLEEGEGLDALARAKVAAESVPIIVMTAEHDERLAVQALRFGAQDYLDKHAGTQNFLRSVRHAVERHRILADLTQARQREHYLATHDGLTALPNRSALIEQLRRSIAQAARSGREMAVLFLDLDRFKGINDTLGHPVGDDLLKLVGERLSRLVRRSDILGRLGGDEFMVLLQSMQRDSDPARVAEKIGDALSKPFVLGGREYRITASIGIAVYPRDGIDPDVLIRNADIAMYHAKAEGLNRFSYYSQGMNAIVAKRLDIENGLREALEANAFSLLYQPLVDIGIGSIFGAEALLRWQDRRGGAISPAEFMPMAEETGVVTRIGEWVLRKACEDAVRWRPPDGRKVQLSVNVSSKQLGDPRFADVVTRTLRETGLAPSRLELEITESSVLHEHGVTRSNLQYLRQLGVRIAIDDFGTGYSSLTALKHLPVDRLKIDRTFVCDITTEPADATITSGLITMARGLGLAVTAEGVETRQQLELLYRQGCHQMQGYLFGKPVVTDEFAHQLLPGESPWERELPGPGD